MGLFIPRALFPARCSPCIDTHKDMGLHYNQDAMLDFCAHEGKKSSQTSAHMGEI